MNLVRRAMVSTLRWLDPQNPSAYYAFGMVNDENPSFERTLAARVDGGRLLDSQYGEFPLSFFALPWNIVFSESRRA